jgi:ABC-type uncharacterized transport system substrate-binding protein
MKKIFTYPLFFFLLLAGEGFCTAHMFIEYKVQFCIDNEGMKGLFVQWTLDQIYSSFIKEKFDVDKNAILSRDEQAAIFTSAFNLFKENNWFAVLSDNGKSLPVPQPQRFSARFEKTTGLVSYVFFLPLHIAPEKVAHVFEACFFDPIVDATFTIKEKDITAQNKSKNIEATPGMKVAGHISRPTLSFKESKP